jgi:hypothetical protein
MINLKRIIIAFILPLVWVALAQAGEVTESSNCLHMTSNESRCKDCCDCMDADGATRRSCRDNCTGYDFSQNSEVIPVDAPSVLGVDGDYSAALQAETEQGCKEYCDGSDNLACGDRHFCRDACNANFGGSARRKPQDPGERGLPPEIVEACQGKDELAVCQVGESFTGRCYTLQNQLACLLSQEEASADLNTQWELLDRNRDGFLDVNEIKGDGEPKSHPRRDK